MTTVSQIITDAYQYNNLVALGEIPSAAEQDKGLRYLNRIVRGVFGNEIGEQLINYNVTDTGIEYDYSYLSSFDEVVPINARLVCNITAAVSFDLPEKPRDGDRFSVIDAGGTFATTALTINGNGRLIEGVTSLVLSEDGTNTEWFYRADQGGWVKLSDLILTDDFPLPMEFEEYFILLLSMRLNGSEAVETTNTMGAVMRDVMKKLKSRYTSSIEMTPDIDISPSRFLSRLFNRG